MTSDRTFVITVAVALVAGGFAGHAWQPPARVEYREREVIKYRDREQTNVKIATVSAPVVKTIYRDRTVTVPGGTVTVEHWREREDKGEVKTTAEEQTVIIREVDKIRDVLRIETRAPLWFVGASGGIDTSLAKYAAVNAGMRIVGPVYLQAQVASSMNDVKPVATVGVMVQF